MIKVEQKFILTKEDIERLTAGAEFLNERTFKDAYYDTTEFALTRNDMWLRKRGEEFELKIPMHLEGNKTGQQYQKIEGAEKIREIFAVAPIGSFEDDIAAFDYAPFCECVTIRRKFRVGSFVIDLDEIEYGDFSYCIGEIELMVNEKSEISNAINKIEAFAGDNLLTIAPVRGKVIEYLKRKKDPADAWGPFAFLLLFSECVKN